MFNFINDIIAYDMLRNALIVGPLITLCASVLGVSLVLKRYSMIGDGLSHVSFGVFSIATVFNFAPLVVSIPIVIFAAFLLLRINSSSKIKGDAATAIISTGSLALGVLVVSMTSGMNTNISGFMFGSLLTITKSDVIISISLSIVVLLIFVLFYNKIFSVTFDETFARATGIRAEFYNMVIAFLTAITIVLGMRMMGALLISGLVIFPALTSMRVFKSFIGVTICSAVISIICFIFGFAGVFAFDTPPGASIIIVNIIMFVLFWCINLLKRKGFYGKNKNYY